MFASNRRLNQSSSSYISISDNYWSENNANVNYGWNQASFTVNKTQPFFSKICICIPFVSIIQKEIPPHRRKIHSSFRLTSRFSALTPVIWLFLSQSSWKPEHVDWPHQHHMTPLDPRVRLCFQTTSPSYGTDVSHK